MRRGLDSQYSQPEVAATSEDGRANGAFSALGRTLEDLALELRRTKCIALMDLVVPKEEVRLAGAMGEKGNGVVESFNLTHSYLLRASFRVRPVLSDHRLL